MNNQHFINSLYLATEGEGIHVGLPQIFVRYQGCNIGCANCDSKETWEFDSLPPVGLEQIIEQIKELKVKRVSITGGDPLHPRHHESVLSLVQTLKSLGYYINLEASGSRVVDSIFDLVDFISFDYKTPSTKVKTSVKLISKLAQQYRHKFQIKSVIADNLDFENVWNAYQEVKLTYPAMDFFWCLTPAWTPGEVFNQSNFVKTLKNNELLGAPFRVIGQQHKWVYGAEAKQV